MSKKSKKAADRCKYVWNVKEKQPIKFGFGEIFDYNADLDLYTIIDDKGRIVQRQSEFVFFPGNNQINKEK